MRVVVVAVIVLATAATAAAQPGATPPQPVPAGATPATATPSTAAAPPADLAQPLTPPGATPPRPLAQPASPESSSHDGELSEATAFLLSAGGTLSAWTVLIANAARQTTDYHTQTTIAELSLLGTLVAPSFGHWYAHAGLTRGLGLRVLAAGITFVGFVGLAGSDDGTPSAPEAALLFGGIALYLVGTVDDIVTAPGEARRYNERHRISIAPIIRTDHRDNHTFGLALIGQF